MASFSPSKVFATVPSLGIKRPKIEDNHSENEIPLSNIRLSDRKIQVSAVGEVSLPPDRCRLTIKIKSQKEDAQEAKNSITRRLDYILQTLNNYGIKESDMNIFKTLRRSEGVFCMECELQAVFVDIGKCQTVANFLVEKLDESVTICLPEFYHASVTMQNLRQQASLLAIHNAKQKAQEMAKFVHQTVGHPISIEEEESKEWHGNDSPSEDVEKSQTVQQRIADASVTVSCKVSVCFDLKQKVKTKSIK